MGVAVPLGSASCCWPWAIVPCPVPAQAGWEADCPGALPWGKAGGVALSWLRAEEGAPWREAVSGRIPGGSRTSCSGSLQAGEAGGEVQMLLP